MRETRQPQTSIFDFYSEHEFGKRLKELSTLLDEHELAILPLIEQDLICQSTTAVGRCGLTVESVLRCLLLKLILQISYNKSAFLLSDSMSYRSFARLADDVNP